MGLKVYIPLSHWLTHFVADFLLLISWSVYESQLWQTAYEQRMSLKHMRV